MLVRRWEKFLSTVDRSRTADAVAAHFPFKEYFSDAPQPIFSGKSFDQVGS
jgi:intron-binding protein aquarius